MKFTLALFALFFLLLEIGGIATAHAAQIQWRNNRYSHYANREDIKAVLTDFFAAQGIGVICSEQVTGKVSGNFKNKRPGEFFRHITDAYNLIWYYDGAAVYLYSAHEMTSKVLNLGYLNMVRFHEHLAALDILDPRYAMRMIEKERLIYVSGPERYVDLISDIATQLDAKAKAYGGLDDVVKIFPLKHAWAEDKKLHFQNNEVVIPGVATILKNLIAGTTKPNSVVGADNRTASGPLRKLKGQGLKRTRTKAKKKSAPENEKENQRYPEWLAGPDSNLDLGSLMDTNAGGPDQHFDPPPLEARQGTIQSDPRQNAVIVRDREEKMPYYQEIVDMLDAPVHLVEIRAAIIDIGHDDFKDIGMQWEFLTTRDGGEKVTRGGLNTDGLFSQKEGLQLPTGSGLNLATLIGDASDFLLAKVNALEKKGQAKILSRPSVLTLNNIEAQLQHSRTFYVRLEGEREVDLYDIDSGVTLRVTPHIIEKEDSALVKLAIQIEDGDLTGEEVDDIPVVTRSVINTQAVVGQQESLLIGGYRKNRYENHRQGIPCLGDIPLLSWLFKRQETVIKDRERLFLITPTIVPFGTSNSTGEEKKLQSVITETIVPKK